MQLFSMCMECQKELGHPSFEPFLVPYYDDRITYFTCSRGHRSAHVIQSQKFEVLMESGANALAAGFTLEASASFSAALERLYEFAIKVFVTHRETISETYAEMFKAMSRQSERQLGAFMALYAVEFNSAYKPNEKIVEFRNSVIHKGLIPTPEDAQKFCSKVYSEVLKITELLNVKHSEAVNKVVLMDLNERYQKVESGVSKATAPGSIFFSLASTLNKRNFQEAFISFQEHKEKLLQSVPYMQALHLLVQSNIKA